MSMSAVLWHIHGDNDIPHCWLVVEKTDKEMNVNDSKSVAPESRKMPSMEDQGQTERVTTPTRAGLHRCLWPGRATPHASPR